MDNEQALTRGLVFSEEMRRLEPRSIRPEGNAKTEGKNPPFDGFAGPSGIPNYARLAKVRPRQGGASTAACSAEKAPIMKCTSKKTSVSFMK